MKKFTKKLQKEIKSGLGEDELKVMMSNVQCRISYMTGEEMNKLVKPVMLPEIMIISGKYENIKFDENKSYKVWLRSFYTFSTEETEIMFVEEFDNRSRAIRDALNVKQKLLEKITKELDIIKTREHEPG